MMKYTGGLSLGLGLLFAVPAMTFGGGLPDSLGTALEETKSALEVLVKLERQITAGRPLPAEVLVEMTETPLGDARTRDELHSELRDEVAELQAKLDTKKVAVGTPSPPPPTDTNAPVTSGLSPDFLKTLAVGQQGPLPQVTAELPTVAQGGDVETKPSPTPAVSPEGQGYSANTLRQAQACYRAERYTQGLQLLEASKPSPTVTLWTARFLERLDRTDEAIALYTALETDDAASELHDAAKRDREFAEWRQDFQKKADLKPVATKTGEKQGS